MPAQNDNRTVQGSATSGRKAYESPRLSCYGDVGSLTQTLNTQNQKNDNSMNPNSNKT